MLKVIVKTAVKTLVILIIVGALGFGIVSLATPGVMAYAFEQCGAYSVAAGYASIQYKYTGKVDDLDRCFRDCVAAGNDKGCVRFGTELIKDPRFAEYCERMNESLSDTMPDNYGKGVDYAQYVYGKTACARYSSGESAEAVKLVEEGLRHTQGFPYNNAAVELCVKAAEKSDAETKSKLLEIISKITPAESESDYYNKVKKILEE